MDIFQLIAVLALFVLAALLWAAGGIDRAEAERQRQRAQLWREFDADSAWWQERVGHRDERN